MDEEIDWYKKLDMIEMFCTYTSIISPKADISIGFLNQEFERHNFAYRIVAIVTVVALYDKPQMLPLPEMYGKNLTFKTGGVDGCDCTEILRLIEAGKIDTTHLSRTVINSLISRLCTIFSRIN